jgi:hypothetical protein
MHLDAHPLMHGTLGLVILRLKFLEEFGKIKDSEVILHVSSTRDKVFLIDEYIHNPLLRR